MGRVLNVLYEQRFGGPQSRVLQVACGLRRLGWETVVAIPRGDPTFARHMAREQVPFHEMELVRLRRSLNPRWHARYLARFWPNVFALRRLIREHRIEVVHTNGVMHLQAAVAARLEGIALVWHLTDTQSLRLVRSVCLPLVCRWADRIAISARAVADYYFPGATGLQDRLHLLYAPVDTSRFCPGPADPSLRSELGVPENCPLIGTVANIVPGKGLEFLVEAVAPIRQRFPAARFLVVGTPLENRRRYWEALLARREQLSLQDHLVFAGPRNDVARLLRSLTLYVHPSESEACPMAVQEASASGLPVVATDVGGTRELIENGVSGLVVPPRSSSAIAAAVIQLLEAPEVGREMGARGARRMDQLFSLGACVEQHVRLYENAIRARTRHSPGERHVAARS